MVRGLTYCHFSIILALKSLLYGFLVAMPGILDRGGYMKKIWCYLLVVSMVFPFASLGAQEEEGLNQDLATEETEYVEESEASVQEALEEIPEEEPVESEPEVVVVEKEEIVEPLTQEEIVEQEEYVEPVEEENIIEQEEYVEPVMEELVVEQEEYVRSEGTQTSSLRHKVLRGDTLWELSDKYYNNPFRWRAIYNANSDCVSFSRDKCIRNPHWIYPNQKFVIPGVEGRSDYESVSELDIPPGQEIEYEDVVEEVSEYPEDQEQVELAEEKLEERKTSFHVKIRKEDRFTGNSFIAAEDWEFDGYILEEREQKAMIAMGDTVYLDVGSNNNISPRMKGLVFRKDRKMYHPDTGILMGHLVRRVGMIEMTYEVGPESSSAIVIASYEPIHAGDIVRFSGKSSE